MAESREIVLRLDCLDFEAVQEAMALRKSWDCMPDHESNHDGALIAEICRGWLERLAMTPPYVPNPPTTGV